MKHLPAFKAAVIAVAGILLGRTLPQYSTIFLSFAVAVLFLTVAYAAFRRRKPAGLLTGGAYLSLFLSFAFYMSLNLSALEEIRQGEFQYYTGRVSEISRDTSRPSILLTDCYGFERSWKRIHGDLVVSPETMPVVNVGDRIVLRGKAGRMSDARNPGQFNLKRYYRLNGIAGRIYIDGSRGLLAVRRDTSFGFQKNVIYPVREYIRDRIASLMSGEEAGLARAMILGERMGLSRETSDNFSRSGTIHVLAVSGLHIGFLTGILMTLAALVRVPRRRRIFLVATVLVFYAFVIGLTPSVTRAVIMAVVVLFAIYLQRRGSVINSLGFAALIILCFSPTQLFSPGFQLSFVAVLSIAFFYERLQRAVRRAHPLLVERPFLNSVMSVSLLTLAATLGTVPLCAYYFERVSLAGVIVNLFVVPLSGIFVSLNFTFILLSLLSNAAASVYAASSQVVGFLILGINYLAGSIPLSSLRTGDSSVLFGILYVAWLVSSFLFGKHSLLKKSIFALLLGLNMILIFDIVDNIIDAELYVLDVGQGDALYFELPDGKRVLVDSGVKFGKYDIGSRVIVPFLRRRGVDELDYFVLTHLHGDHIGGAVSVLKSVKVRNFIYPEQTSTSRTWAGTFAAVRALGVPARTLRAGTILDSGAWHRVYVLHPNGKYVGKGGLSYKTRFNNGSIVLKLCVGGRSALLAGDIERAAEHDLAATYGRFLSAEVLKAGHHGSSTSSSSEFLSSVRPKYAVISVGAGNRFGHPSGRVLERMRKAGISVIRTDSAGAAYFRLSPDHVERVDWR